jgi:hypothetical protein
MQQHVPCVQEVTSPGNGMGTSNGVGNGNVKNNGNGYGIGTGKGVGIGLENLKASPPLTYEIGSTLQPCMSNCSCSFLTHSYSLALV